MVIEIFEESAEEIDVAAAVARWFRQICREPEHRISICDAVAHDVEESYAENVREVLIERGLATREAKLVVATEKGLDLIAQVAEMRLRRGDDHSRVPR